MKESLEKIKDVVGEDKGKRFFFFGFYALFFIVIMIVARVGTRVPIADSSEYEPGVKNYRFYANKINENNFSYIYTITLDGVKYQYNGERYGDSELFFFNNQEYYREKDNYYVKNGGWIKTDNPYIFSEFLGINNYSNILPMASFDSKTKYQNNKEAYNYLISSNTINKILKNIDSDFMEVPNTLTLGTDIDRNIEKITFNLDSYCKVNGVCNNQLMIELSYDKFGEVSKIVSPIS